jgi:NAD(P)-dependent dehydrogenase (short-subunit alcohol dehydrogenase family)
MTSKRCYVITGASRGIGLELVRQAVAAGHLVIAGVRNLDKARAKPELAGAELISLDVTSDASVLAFAADVAKLSQKIDVLINNAGVGVERTIRATETSPELLMKTFDTNVYGPVRVVTALLRELRAAPHAVIGNISSVMGSFAENTGGSTAYRMSKTALNMFSQNLALEEKKLTVLALHPGWVQTDMGGTSAPVTPKQSAAGLLRVISTATTEQSGRHFDYQGHVIAW